MLFNKDYLRYELFDHLNTKADSLQNALHSYNVSNIVDIEYFKL